MKVIDLLNKIANGEEVPKKFKYDCYVWTYNYESSAYWNGKSIEFEDYMDDGLMKYLNDEVEILEEKEIPEKICTNRIINTKDILEFEMIQNKINAEYTYAINEIIDYLKSKGE